MRECQGGDIAVFAKAAASVADDLGDVCGTVLIKQVENTWVPCGLVEVIDGCLRGFGVVLDPNNILFECACTVLDIINPESIDVFRRCF